MKVGDVVVFRQAGFPPVGVGQVIGYTAKRVRMAVRNGAGYITLLRAPHNVKVSYRSRSIL